MMRMIIMSLSLIDIDYYNALKIVEILKETEADSKNILGYYSSQRMKDWQEVIKLYEKESVYLGMKQDITHNTYCILLSYLKLNLDFTC